MRLLKMLAVVLAMSLSLFAAESPFSGTWKLNLAKSTPPVPKSDIAVVDADENGLKLNQDIVTDKGESLKISYEAKFDGKDYPVLRFGVISACKRKYAKRQNKKRWKSCN